MLYHHFYSRHPDDRKANMVLVSEEPPKYVSKQLFSEFQHKQKTKKFASKKGEGKRTHVAARIEFLDSFASIEQCSVVSLIVLKLIDCLW